MKLRTTPEINLEKITEAVQELFPHYEVKLLKNPLGRFQYVQIRKSAFIGVWIRLFEKKETLFFMGCIPSVLARALFGGLIVMLFLMSKQKQLITEIGEAVQQKFGLSTF